MAFSIGKLWFWLVTVQHIYMVWSDRLFKGGVTGSPGTSAFWYMAVIVPWVVPFPYVVSSEKECVIYCEEHKCKNGGTYRPGILWCFLQQHWPEMFPLAWYGHTEHSNRVHREDPSTSCCRYRDEQLEPVLGLVGFVVYGMA